MIEGDVYNKWCKCGAPLASRDGVLVPPDMVREMCGPCTRHDKRHTANCAAIVDCMIVIARASRLEAAGDSQPLALAREHCITTLKKQLE